MSMAPHRTGQNRRPPLSSRKYTSLLVVPMNTHWRGSVTSRRP